MASRSVDGRRKNPVGGMASFVIVRDFTGDLFGQQEPTGIEVC
jgi:hypothetical protein